MVIYASSTSKELTAVTFSSNLPADCLVAHSIFVQVFNRILSQLFGLAHGAGEIGMGETDIRDRCVF